MLVLSRKSLVTPLQPALLRTDARLGWQGTARRVTALADDRKPIDGRLG
jgi:hypothetical protein